MVVEQAAGQMITAPLMLFFGLFGVSTSSYNQGLNNDKVLDKGKVVVEYLVAVPSSYYSDSKISSTMLLVKSKVDQGMLKKVSESKNMLILKPFIVSKETAIEKALIKTKEKMRSIKSPLIIVDEVLAFDFKDFVCAKERAKVVIIGKKSPCKQSSKITIENESLEDILHKVKT